MIEPLAPGEAASLRALADCRLYGILDLGYITVENAVPVAREMMAAGVDILQVRAKQLPAAEILRLVAGLRPIAHAASVPLLINDYAALAAAARADGVHIGQDDGPMEEARTAAGSGKLVGRSTHSLAQARAARAEGADYLGFGPLFATPTKPDYPAIGLGDIAQAHAEVPDRPIFCIGGIKLENLPEDIAAGARRVVIVSGILLARDVAEYTSQAAKLLREVDPVSG